jgi:hypothetical protein
VTGRTGRGAALTPDGNAARRASGEVAGNDGEAARAGMGMRRETGTIGDA